MLYWSRHGNLGTDIVCLTTLQWKSLSLINDSFIPKNKYTRLCKCCFWFFFLFFLKMQNRFSWLILFPKRVWEIVLLRTETLSTDNPSLAKLLCPLSPLLFCMGEFWMSVAQVCGKESSLCSVWEFGRILLAAIGRSAIFVECILLVFLMDFLFWLLHVSQLQGATLMFVWCTGSEFNKLKILIFQICTSLKYSSEKYCFNWPYWGHLFSSFLCLSFFLLVFYVTFWKFLNQGWQLSSKWLFGWDIVHLKYKELPFFRKIS